MQPRGTSNNTTSPRLARSSARAVPRSVSLLLACPISPPCGSVYGRSGVTMSGADTAGSATSTPRNPPTAANDVLQPHDRPTFVTPRDFLEQGRPILPPRALTAVDKEQLDGLVRACATLGRAWANRETENHPRVSQGPDELRRAAAQLPLDRLRHGAARQEEPKHTHTEWCAAPCASDARTKR